MIAGTVALDPELNVAKAFFPEIDFDAETTDDGSIIVFPTSDADFERMAEQMGLPLE